MVQESKNLFFPLYLAQDKVKKLEENKKKNKNDIIVKPQKVNKCTLSESSKLAEGDRGILHEKWNNECQFQIICDYAPSKLMHELKNFPVRYNSEIYSNASKNCM